MERCGLRARIANKVFDVRLEELHKGDYTRHPEIGEKRLRDGVEFVERWHGRANGRIMDRIGTHATETRRAGLHREARAEANRLGVRMHIHKADLTMVDLEKPHLLPYYGGIPHSSSTPRRAML